MERIRYQMVWFYFFLSKFSRNATKLSSCVTLSFFERINDNFKWRNPDKKLKNNSFNKSCSGKIE